MPQINTESNTTQTVCLTMLPLYVKRLLNHVMLILVSDYNSTRLSFLVTRKKGEPGASGTLTQKQYYIDKSDQVGQYFMQANLQLVTCKYFITAYIPRIHSILLYYIPAFILVSIFSVHFSEFV